MAERQVNFIVTMEGAEEVSQATSDMDRALRDASRTTIASSRAARDATRRQQELERVLSQQIQGWGTLGTAMGQAGAVLGRVSPQFAGFGAVLGQAGQSITSVATALASPNPASVTSALISVGATIADAVSAWRRYQEATDNTRRSIDDVAQSARDAIGTIEALAAAQESATSRRALQSRLELGLASGAQQEAFVVEAQKQRRRAEADLQILEGRRERLIREQGGLTRQQRANIDEETEAIERRTSAVNEEIERRQQLAAQRRREESAGVREQLQEDADSGGGRGGRGSRGVTEAQRQEELQIEIAVAATQEAIRRRQELERAHTVWLQQEAERRAREEQEAEQAVDQAIQEQMAKEDEAKQQQHEAQMRRLEEAKQQERDAREELRAGAESQLAPVVSNITTAMSQVIAGAESADEAFQGLLASFLEMISQQAALEAAKEFAASIASFASQDYGGGALHLAAGIAWTGVAIAAGGAAVAVAPPAAAPATPEQSSAGGGGGGDVTNIYQVNGTIIQAEGTGARARAGRAINQLGSEGNRRFGRAS